MIWRRSGRCMRASHGSRRSSVRTAQRSAARGPLTHSRAADGAAGPTEWAHFRGAAAAPGDAAAAQQKHKLVSMMQKRCFYHTPVGRAVACAACAAL